MGSRRYRIETKDEQVIGIWKWRVRVIDTVTGEMVASYPPMFATEREAREQGEYEVRNFERKNASHWRAH